MGLRQWRLPRYVPTGHAKWSEMFFNEASSSLNVYLSFLDRYAHTRGMVRSR